MNNRTIILALGLSMALGLGAQTRDGGISQQMLDDIRKAEAGNTAGKALFNAIAANSIDDIARNHANQGAVDTHFSVETATQSISDQKSSGRCWMFSGFNVLRANFAKQHGDSLDVEFSHDYLFFYDQLEKANLMLQGVIDCAFEENGCWVLADYKTDRILDDSSFVERYTMQLNWYTRALEAITGRKVSEMWLYALTKGRAYPVERRR